MNNDNGLIDEYENIKTKTKIFMIDKEDLFTAAKSNELYQHFLEYARNKAKELGIECIELKGVFKQAHDLIRRKQKIGPKKYNASTRPRPASHSQNTAYI